MREISGGAAKASLILGALILALVLSSSISLALTYYGYTDKNLYEKNEMINYTAYVDVNLSSNVSVSLVNSSTGAIYNHSNVSVTQNYFTITLNASVASSGEYIVRTNFTYNSTTYKNDIIMKISNARYFYLFADKSSYYPNEAINFTVKALDKNNLDVSGEPVTIKLSYTNYTTISQASGVTNILGEFSSSISAPPADGSYMLSVNDWLAFKTITVGGFDLVSYSGDSLGNTKTKFDVNESAYIYVDLLTPNKTRYSGLESVSINITYPSGIFNTTAVSFSGEKMNYSIRLNETGSYFAKITVLSNSKFLSYNFSATNYELKASAVNSRGTNIFFPNETAPITVKVYNASSGELLTSNFSNTTLWNWRLELLGSNNTVVLNISNSTLKAADNSYPFLFNVTNVSTGTYYIKIRLNQTEITEDIIVQDFEAQAMPVDQDYQFKNIFISGKNNVRILATLSNASGDINVTNISVLGIKKGGSENIKDRLSINESTINYKLVRAGLVEFAPPADADWYYARMLVNNRYIAETWFAVKIYSTCSQLSGYKWFVGTSEDASLEVTVSTAQEAGFMEGIGGKEGNKGSEVVSSGAFGNMYGMSSCSAGNSTSGGNVSANVQVSVTKVVNTLTSEDYTKKLSSLPSGTSNSNGVVTLNITKPSGGWSGGSYIVEFDLKDNKNNTDKGFGWFNVKSLWVNVWPQQNSGYWRWYFGPRENFTFNVYSYNTTNTWYSYYSSPSGVGDNCSVVNVYYQGSGGEWFWPPKPIETGKYNYTCTGSQGRFNLTVIPNSAFKSGYYIVRVKVNTSTTSDTGDGWFSVKLYNVYLKSNTSNWYDSWYIGSRNNATFRFEVTYANNTDWNCGWDTSVSCTNKVSEKLNVTITKIMRYDGWMPVEYARWKYNVSIINATNNVSYGSMNITTGNGTIVLVPKGGTNNQTWESGYYSAIVEVTGTEGSETGTAWFESRPFFVEVTPVNSSAGYPSKWRFKSTDNITVNVSAASKPSWMKYYSSYSNSTYQYYNANISAITLSRYSYTDWRMQNVTILNYTPSNISGVTVVNITPASLSAGSYNLEITLQDNESNTAKGYAWFEVRDFTLSAQIADWRWKFNNTENITLTITACDADTWWCSGSGLSGVNVNVTKVMKTNTWPYIEASGWATNQSTTTASGAGLNIYRTSGNWESGYYTAEVTGVSGSSTQTANVWFEIESFSMYVWANKWEYGMRENVSLNVQVSQAVTVDDVSVTCGYYPSSQTYSKSAGTLNISPTSLSGTANITFIPTTGRWSSGYCNGQITAHAATDTSATKMQWFSFNVQPIKVDVSNYKYNYLKNESVLLTVNTQQAINFTVSLQIWLPYGDSWSNYTQFTMSARNFTNTSYNNILNLTPNGTWGYNYYIGQMNISLADDASASSSIGFYFGVNPPYCISLFNPYTINKTERGQNFTFYVSSNSSAGASGLNITLNSIKYWPYSCYNNCNYQTDSGWNATNTTTNSTGYATINITRASDWNYGSNSLIFTINDSVELVNVTAGIWAS